MTLATVLSPQLGHLTETLQDHQITSKPYNLKVNLIILDQLFLLTILNCIYIYFMF